MIDNHTKRRISWVLGALAYVLPAAWIFGWASYDDRQPYPYGSDAPAWGMLRVMIEAFFGAALLSGLAFFFGSLAFRALSKPRGIARRVELAVLVLPLVLGGSFLVCFLLLP